MLDDSDTHERQRLELLACTRLLDSEENESFDRITRLAASLFDAPIAMVSLVDRRRQWFKSRIGLAVRETARSSSFCSHAIAESGVTVIEDAGLDPRFADNPMVTGAPHVRFYAGAPLRLASGHALGTLCIIDTRPRTFGAVDRARLADLAALVMAQVDLHQTTGRIDSVTRLPNRARLDDDLETLCQQSPGEARALMLLDVMGHAQLQAAVRAVGVRPLEGTMREIAAKVRSALRPGTTLYHVSETRFAFIAQEATTAEHDQAAARLVAAMREPFRSGGICVELDIQCGLVAFDLVPADAADALRRATSAMHESISLGTSHLWHGDSFDAAHRRGYALLRDVQPGLQRGEFRLVYQPKLNLRTGRYSGVEALARWQHPTLGNVSPGEFIPLVESTTLIHEFTPWVIDTALAQLRRWEAEGIDLTIAVNVSSRNLDHPAFLDLVRDACRRHGVSAERLHVECTEHSVMTGAATQAALQALRDMGAQISLDDFGMGFSNLSCLSSLPVQLLKIDQSLVFPIARDPRACRLVTSLIQMGHALGYRMLAEGVESREVFELLVAADCDAIQGFFLSRPLEPAALLAFMRERVEETLIPAS
jgi:EAL domain-containing protein (putative c-di-GMP-specific phosphodiesterase class I)/GAF domain-containing protein